MICTKSTIMISISYWPKRNYAPKISPNPCNCSRHVHLALELRRQPQDLIGMTDSDKEEDHAFAYPLSIARDRGHAVLAQRSQRHGASSARDNSIHGLLGTMQRS